jgi:hypothetical protein
MGQSTQWTPHGAFRTASNGARDQRVMVVSVDFFVAIESPDGVTVLPLESDRLD